MWPPNTASALAWVLLEAMSCFEFGAEGLGGYFYPAGQR
jgi:hypothetical protein